MASSEVLEAIQATAEICNRTLSEFAAKILVSDLSAYRDADVLHALVKCRKELRTFPSVADIISRIQQKDGRPGVEEAWSLCPISESQSTVWTPEIQRAFFEAAFPLLETDPIGARMAFKETYPKFLADARERNEPVKWEVSLGHDKHGRESVLLKAVELGRLEASKAQMLLPDVSFSQGLDASKKLLAKLTADA